jgi:hypothetical protein
VQPAPVWTPEPVWLPLGESVILIVDGVGRLM